MKKILVIIFITIISLYGYDDKLDDTILIEGCNAIIADKDSINKNSNSALTYYYIKGTLSVTMILFKKYKIKNIPKAEEICAFSRNSNNSIIAATVYLTGKMNGINDEEIIKILNK